MSNRSELFHGVIKTFAILSCLLWLGSCGDTSSNPSVQTPSKVAEFIDPDLSNLGEMVQNEIKSRHQVIQKLENAPERNVSKLALAYGSLAMYYQSFEFPQQAQYLYQKAIELVPQDFKWQYLLARVYQARYQHDDAKVQFQKALQLDEFHVPSLLALGEYARRAGTAKEATTYFNNALLLEKRCVFARLGLAQMAIEEKDFKRATELMEEALQIQERGTELHYQAAMAYRGLGNLEKAQYHLDQQKKFSETTFIRDPLMDQVHQISKQDRTFVERGNRALEENNFEAAAKFFQHATLINPSVGETRLKLASALLQLGQLDQAKIEFETADRLRPGNYQIAFNLAGIALEQANFDEAKKQLNRAIEQKDDFAAAHLKLADIYLIKKEYQPALDHYMKVMELEPTNPAARVGRSLMLIRLNRHNEARQALEADLVQFPSHPSLGILLVKILAASPEAEVRDGKRAITIVNTMAKAGRTLELLEAGAMAYAETSAFKEAIRWQEEAIALARKNRPERVSSSEALLKAYKNQKPCRNPFPQDS